MTHNKSILSLMKKLYNAVTYAIEVNDENCDCGECGPCKHSKRWTRLLKQAEAVLNLKTIPGEAGKDHSNKKNPTKPVIVPVTFDGAVTVQVPDHLSEEDAKLLATKLALSRAVATTDNPDASDLEACEEYEEECSRQARRNAVKDWDACAVDGIGGGWNQSTPDEPAEPPWACECDNTHQQNGTVCRYCRDKLGRRKWDDPEPKRCVAMFQPQVWVNNYATDVDSPIPFDITDRILAMPKKQALAIRDYSTEADDLVPASLMDWLAKRYGEERACNVTLAQAIRNYFARGGRKG